MLRIPAQAPAPSMHFERTMNDRTMERQKQQDWTVDGYKDCSFFLHRRIKPQLNLIWCCHTVVMQSVQLINLMASSFIWAPKPTSVRRRRKSLDVLFHPRCHTNSTWRCRLQCFYVSADVRFHSSHINQTHVVCFWETEALSLSFSPSFSPSPQGRAYSGVSGSSRGLLEVKRGHVL